MAEQAPSDAFLHRLSDWSAETVTITRPTVAEEKPMSEYERKIAAHRRGADLFRDGSRALDFNLDGFWRWSASDLLSNATRGLLAEYIVARALGVDVDVAVRDEWGAYDLHMREDAGQGIKIEVKSSAYLQSWKQKGPSKISFSVRKTRATDELTGALSPESAHQADLYVFALLMHPDKTTVDPMDVSQWCFYVVPTSELAARSRSQHSITLPSLKALTSAVTFGELKAKVIGVSGAKPGAA